MAGWMLGAVDKWTCEQQAVISEDGAVFATSGNLWRCDDKQCVLRSLICNDLYDCEDKSDERNCRNLYTFLYSYFSFITETIEFMDLGETEKHVADRFLLA